VRRLILSLIRLYRCYLEGQMGKAFDSDLSTNLDRTILAQEAFE